MVYFLCVVPPPFLKLATLTRNFNICGSLVLVCLYIFSSCSVGLFAAEKVVPGLLLMSPSSPLYKLMKDLAVLSA